MVPKRLWRPWLRGFAGMAALGLGGLILGLLLAPALAQQTGKSEASKVELQPAVKSAAPTAKVHPAVKKAPTVIGSAASANPTTATSAAPVKKSKAKLAEEAALADPFAPEHPQMILDGLHCQIHRDGKVRQEIVAKTGQFDELANILDLKQLNVKYLDQGTTTVGQATCGSGRVWTTDHPEQGINAHDMLLQQNVRLETREMLLTAPEMRYNALTSTVSSDKKYGQRLIAGRSTLIGWGQRFELKLNLEKNSFEYWKAYGAPAVMQKYEKPVSNP